MAAGDLREIPPVWCSWYQYYSAVTAEDILINLATTAVTYAPAWMAGAYDVEE